jgi:hypothetical protein
MTIDLKFPGDIWTPIWSERDPNVYSELMGLWIMHDGSFYNLVVHVDEWAYVNDWRVFFPDAAAEHVTVTARIAYKDENGTPVTALTQTIDIVINGNGEDTGCSAATVTMADSALNKDLAFSTEFAATGEWENKKVEIMSAMTIESTSDAFTKNCQVSYKLYADDGSGNWDEWSVLKNKLIEEVPHLTSEIHFDRYSAYLSVDISNKDYEHFKATRFTDGTMKFKIKAIVHGSDEDGPEALFQINFIEAAAVD